MSAIEVEHLPLLLEAASHVTFFHVYTQNTLRCIPHKVMYEFSSVNLQQICFHHCVKKYTVAQFTQLGLMVRPSR